MGWASAMLAPQVTKTSVSSMSALQPAGSSVWKTFMKPTTAEAMHRRALGSMLLESRPAFQNFAVQ